MRQSAHGRVQTAAFITLIVARAPSRPPPSLPPPSITSRDITVRSPIRSLAASARRAHFFFGRGFLSAGRPLCTSECCVGPEIPAGNDILDPVGLSGSCAEGRGHGRPRPVHDPGKFCTNTGQKLPGSRHRGSCAAWLGSFPPQGRAHRAAAGPRRQTDTGFRPHRMIPPRDSQEITSVEKSGPEPTGSSLNICAVVSSSLR